MANLAVAASEVRHVLNGRRHRRREKESLLLVIWLVVIPCRWLIDRIALSDDSREWTHPLIEATGMRNGIGDTNKLEAAILHLRHRVNSSDSSW